MGPVLLVVTVLLVPGVWPVVVTVLAGVPDVVVER